MKMHLTEKDLEQIDQEQINKLNDLMYDDCIDNYYLHAWITIGQMIEILESHYEEIIIWKRKSLSKIIYSIFTSDRDFEDCTPISESEELADALFEAVKEVL